MGPLEGVRVLDLSRLLPGPACTAWLAGMGAAVDRVEPPGRGDFARHVPPFVDGYGAYFAATSAGKRSLAVDLWHAEGPPLIARLLERYDVLVEGFKPGVMEQMGLGPEVLLARYPRLVIARLSGFGQTGPWRDRPGHDVNYVGLTGWLGLTARGPDGGVALPAAQAADTGGALAAAAGIAAALFARERTGHGRVLDVSLTEAALWMMGPVVTGATAQGQDPAPGTTIFNGGLPVYGTFECADGLWLTLGALEPKFQAALAAETRVLPSDRADLAAVFSTRTRADWLERLEQVCVGELLQPSELADHPQLAARGAAVRIRGTTWVRPPLGEIPAEGRCPALGEHTDEILREAGLSPEALRAAGVVA